MGKSLVSNHFRRIIRTPTPRTRHEARQGVGIKMAQQRDVGMEVRGLNSGSSSVNGQEGIDSRAIVDVD